GRGRHPAGVRREGRQSAVHCRRRGGAMKRVPLETVQARLGEYVETSAKQPVLILRDRERGAGLGGLEPRAERTPLKLREVLERAWKNFEEHGGIPHEQFWNDLAKSADTPAPSPPKRQRSR